MLNQTPTETTTLSNQTAYNTKLQTTAHTPLKPRPQPRHAPKPNSTRYYTKLAGTIQRSKAIWRQARDPTTQVHRTDAPAPTISQQRPSPEPAT